MGLTTYRDCSFSEKRRVLRVFWSRRADESDKIHQAAREYGPYALAMVYVITLELAVIAAALFAAASPWSWVVAVATLLSGVAVLITRDRRRALAHG